MDAAAKGFELNEQNLFFQSAPRSLVSTFCNITASNTYKMVKKKSVLSHITKNACLTIYDNISAHLWEVIRPRNI